MRRFVVVFLVAGLVVGLGCSKKKDAPTGTSTQQDTASCAGKTCDACLHEGGCWWNSKTKACQLGLPQGVDPDKDKTWSNDPGSCQ